MNDILYEAASSYKELMLYEYILIGGTSKRKIIISILSSDAYQFTHVSGLDHLKDIPAVTAKRHREKEQIFKNILRKRINFETISSSKYLDEILSATNDKKIFSVRTRIENLCDIKKYFDEAYKGKFYKWNKNRSNYVNKTRRVQIEADFMLAVPTEEQDITMFLFFFQNNKSDNKDEPLRLTLFSAFTDSYNLSNGQQMLFTILEEKRKNIHTKEETVIYKKTGVQS